MGARAYTLEYDILENMAAKISTIPFIPSISTSWFFDLMRYYK